MALRDELTTLLREELGAGFETATIAAMCKEYTLRSMAAKLKARRVALVDMTVLVAARKQAEAALRAEEQARAKALADAAASVDAELEGV